MGKEFKTAQKPYQGKEEPSVYDQYVDRCRAWNLPPFGEPTFQKEFARLLRDIGVEVRDGKKEVVIDAVGCTRRANCYTGFSIVDEKPETDTPAPPPPPLFAGGSS
jgi:hypothetical protein